MKRDANADARNLQALVAQAGTLWLALLAPLPLAAREWASASAEHKTEAELAEVKGGEVWLQREGEKPFPVKRDQLSKEDRDYVMRLAALGREFDDRILARMLQADVSSEVRAAEREQIWSEVR